jgi:hypothetical protein
LIVLVRHNTPGTFRTAIDRRDGGGVIVNVRSTMPVTKLVEWVAEAAWKVVSSSLTA